MQMCAGHVILCMFFVHVTISDKKHKKIIEISIKKWAFKVDVFSLPPSNKLQGMVQGSAIFQN